MLILSYALGMCFSATSLEQLCLAWSQLHFGVYKEILARPLVLFGFEGQKLGILLENKTHLKSKIWKYVNSKSLAPFFILFNHNENKHRKISSIFWHRKMTSKIRSTTFDLQHPKITSAIQVRSRQCTYCRY